MQKVQLKTWYKKTQKDSITDELVESAKSLSLGTQDQIAPPLVQQRIELFESRSRSQSRENLTENPTMTTLEDNTHKEVSQEHLNQNGEEHDYRQYDSEDDEVTFPGHHEDFEMDHNHVDLPQQITGPNKEFHQKIQPYISQFQSEIKDMAKELATGPPDMAKKLATGPPDMAKKLATGPPGGQTYSNIEGSMVMNPSSGATTKSQYIISDPSPPVTNNSMQVPSQQTHQGNVRGRGGGPVDANVNIRANAGLTSNEWTLFQESVRVLGFECEQESQEIKKILRASPSVTNIKYGLKEIHKNLEKLKRTETRGEEMALKMFCPNRVEVNKLISSYSKVFSQLEAHAEELLENIKPAPQDPSILAIGNLAQNILGAAYAKPIELPEYDGECISDYTPFKEKFKYVIGHCNTPKELWAQHLENSLKGKAQKYIGTKGSWFNKYEELWAHLDNKYSNRWNIATEAVQNFFFQPEPEEDRKQTVDWFYTMKHNLDSLINLGLTMEEVGVNLILQKMPEIHAKEVRQALRTAHAGKDKKQCFSMNTLTDVINDTIAVERLVTPQKPAQSTLNFMTQPTQQGTNGAVSFPSQNTSWEGGRGRGRGRSRGRGSGTSNKIAQCWICLDNSVH